MIERNPQKGALYEEHIGETFPCLRAVLSLRHPYYDGVDRRNSPKHYARSSSCRRNGCRIVRGIRRSRAVQYLEQL